MAGLGGTFGGSKVGRAVVEIVGESAKLRKDLAESQTATQTSTSKMGKAFTAFQAVAVASAAIAGKELLEFAASAIEAFDESEKANLKLQNSLLNNVQVAATSAAAWDRYAHVLQSQTGVQDEATKSSIAMLAQFGLTADQIKELVPLIVDLSLKQGIDMTASTKAVGKAAQGTTGMLSRYIGTVEKGTTAEETFANVQSKLASTVGGFATQEAKTLEGQLRILAANFDDLKESVGGVLVPYLTAGAKAANFFVDQLTGTSEETNKAAAAAKSFAIGQLIPLARVFQLASWGAHKLAGSHEEATDAINEANNQVGLWTLQLQRGTITVDEFKQKTAEAADEARKQGADEDRVTKLLEGANAAARAYKVGLTGVADAHAAARAEARKQMLAELSLAGGFLGLQGAALSLKDSQKSLAQAQARVHRLIEDGKQGSDKYKDAVADRTRAELDAVTSQLSLAQSVADYIDKQKTADTTQKEVNQLVQSYGRMAGLSKDEIKRLTGNVQGLIDTYDQLPAEKHTRIVQDWVTVRSSALGPAQPVASGGIIAGARGFITQGPTFLVGEGMRRTLAGPGAEAVIPLDARGKGILADVVRQAGGGGVSKNELLWVMRLALREAFQEDRDRRENGVTIDSRLVERSSTRRRDLLGGS